MKPSILIIYTGGTIGMKPDPTTGALVPFDFSGIFEEFPTLQSLNIGIEVFTMDPVIDSSNVSPRNWLDLAATLSLTCTAFLGQFTWQLRAVHPRQRFVIS